MKLNYRITILLIVISLLFISCTGLEVNEPKNENALLDPLPSEAVGEEPEPSIEEAPEPNGED